MNLSGLSNAGIEKGRNWKPEKIWDTASSVRSSAGAQIWTGHRLGGKPSGDLSDPIGKGYLRRINAGNQEA
jgi:hypothetical protein